MGKTKRYLKSAVYSACDGVEGGEELKDSMRVTETLFRPGTATVQKVTEAQKKKIRKKIKDSVIKKVTKEVPKKTTKKIAKETAKETAKVTGKVVTGTAATIAGTAAGSFAGPAGAAIGMAAGKLVGDLEGEKIDKRFFKMGNRSRIFSFFRNEMTELDGAKAQNLGENLFKTIGSLLVRNIRRVIKSFLKIFGRLLLILIAGMGITIFPTVLIIVVLYNSPFSIFLPKVTHTQTVLEATEGKYYEFEDKIMQELNSFDGYDSTEFVGVWMDDGAGNLQMISEFPVDAEENLKDVILAYMVRYGVDDMAAEMNDKGKERLQGVFEDMVGMELDEYSRTFTLERNVLDQNGMPIQYPADTDGDLTTQETDIASKDPKSYEYTKSGKNSRTEWKNGVLVEIYDVEQHVKTVKVVLHGADEMATKYDFNKKKMKIFNELKGMLDEAFPSEK